METPIMETQLPLHVSQPLQPNTTISRLHTFFHLSFLLSLLYFRFSSFPYIHGFLPVFSWLLITSSELLHSLLWLLGQATRWRPVSRTVYPERLPADSSLPCIDVFICTADPNSEPTVGVMNTVISAMCLDYPAEKLFVYLSDDGGAGITLLGMKEAYGFAKKWILFCNKYGIETRSPDAYFRELDFEDEKHSGGLSSEFTSQRKEMELRYQQFKQRIERATNSGDANSSSAKDHSAFIQVRYQEFKQRIESARDSGDAELSSSQDHPAFIEVIRSVDDVDEDEENKVNIPVLTYVSREKRPSHPHHFKAGALNVLLRVSGILSNSPYILFLDCDMYCKDPTTPRQAMCFHMDPEVSSLLAFVQFPHAFHNMSKNDIYNDLLRVGFKVQWRGMDGLKGPFLAGSCVYMKREALFRSPQEKDLSRVMNAQSVGSSNVFITSLNHDNESKPICSSEDLSNSLLEEAKRLASHSYEQHTLWGEQIGFLYHSVVEDYGTGLCLHSKGWRSIYHYSSRPSFLGSVTINLNDALIQTTRWNTGLLQVGFSRFCPLTYGLSRMGILQSMTYASYAFQSLSALPMLCYAIVPQLCLLNGISVYPKVSTPWFAIFFLIYISWHFQHIFEMLSTGGSLKLWWNHQRILMIKSVTAYAAGCLGIVMKWFGCKEIKFVLTNKVTDDEQVQRYNMAVFDFHAATELLLPLTMIVSLNVASLLLGLRNALVRTSYNDIFGQILLSLFIVIMNYPIIEGMIIRKDKGRIPITVTIMSGAFFTAILSYGLFRNP